MRPDVTVFGRYTYLVTELFWGAIAFALLRRTDSTRKALRVESVRRSSANAMAPQNSSVTRYV